MIPPGLPTELSGRVETLALRLIQIGGRVERAVEDPAIMLGGADQARGLAPNRKECGFSGCRRIGPSAAGGRRAFCPPARDGGLHAISIATTARAYRLIEDHRDLEGGSAAGRAPS
jgi:hypothetical protein